MMFQNRLDYSGQLTRDVPVDYIVGMYEDGVIPTSKGHRTADGLEREAYITGNVREAALWGFLNELETALDVASRLDE
jgi:hypothetical protein